VIYLEVLERFPSEGSKPPRPRLNWHLGNAVEYVKRSRSYDDSWPMAHAEMG
jgi:hypothetical protein